jgi:hypothetical protein
LVTTFLVLNEKSPWQKTEIRLRRIEESWKKSTTPKKNDSAVGGGRRQQNRLMSPLILHLMMICRYPIDVRKRFV